jgi:hypothetical protein
VGSDWLLENVTLANRINGTWRQEDGKRSLPDMWGLLFKFPAETEENYEKSLAR